MTTADLLREPLCSGPPAPITQRESVIWRDDLSTAALCCEGCRVVACYLVDSLLLSRP